jgi:hypothetical protein
MSGSSPPKKRARSEEVGDGADVKDSRVEEVYVAVHFQNNDFTDDPIVILGAFESLFEAERKIVDDKIITLTNDIDYLDFQEEYAIEFPFPGRSDSDSDGEGLSWDQIFDREALERDVDKLVEKYFGERNGFPGHHTWGIHRTKVVYADSGVVAGFVKSAHKA